MTPDMHSVDSTNVRAVGYKRETCELFVEFHSSGLYVYFDVPEEIYAEFMAAASKGSYLNENIKNHYHYSKL